MRKKEASSETSGMQLTTQATTMENNKGVAAGEGVAYQNTMLQKILEANTMLNTRLQALEEVVFAGIPKNDGGEGSASGSGKEPKRKRIEE